MGEERRHRHEVRPGAEVTELAQRRAADEQAGGEVEEHAQAHRYVAGDDPWAQRQERGYDHEGDGRHVEHEQGVAEAVRALRFFFVEFAQRRGERRHRSADRQ